ncbi:MAG: TrmB family transcriptional regulator [Candidatus Delongbacteria bacterium]|nr:TrmB family transcriptional regulator [Candidatus Delongbacteria bacterium]MBN2835966.1 TrmB family transcriptional regulator [Candidatus Delongbacteria bacterium]
MNEYIEELIKFGFTEYEAKVYYTLLKKIDLSATEISDLSGVPRTKIYYVIENLQKKGLVVKAVGKFKRFRAISPKLGLSSINKDLEDKIVALKNTADSLDQIYNRFREEHEESDFVEILKDPNYIFQKVKQLNADVKQIIRAYHQSPYDGLISGIKANGTKLTKGIKYKFIFEVHDNYDEELINTLRLFEKDGAEVRIMSNVPLKMIIFDQELTFISLENKVTAGTNVTKTTVSIEHAEFSKQFSEFFDYQFSNSHSIESFIANFNR